VKKLAQFDTGWLTVFLCYCTVFGSILVHSDFLPDTLENSEPVSALPRLFSDALYALGIRLELQSAVTVFTVGLLGFWFAYRFLAEISTRLYATIACLLLMTDYIMFAQWHVGMWQTWNMFLLFGGLFLAQRVASTNHASSLLVVYVFHAILFCYGTVFSVYVTAAVFLYFVFATRGYRATLNFGLTQVAGALSAAALLLGHLINQFGWDVVRTGLPHILLNVPDTGSHIDLLSAIRVLFVDHAMHTPLWSLVVLAFAGAEVFRRLRTERAVRLRLSAPVLRRPSRLFDNWDRKVTFKETVLALLALGAVSAGVFCLLVRHPEIVVALPPPSLTWTLELLFIVIAAEILAFWILELLPPVIRPRVWAVRAPLCVPARSMRAFPRFRRIVARTTTNTLGRIDWEIVIKDATTLSPFAVMMSGAALFRIVSKHPEVMTTFAVLSPLVIGVGLVCAATAFLASPTILTRPGRIVGASIFLAALLAFLVMHPLLYTGMASLEPIWRMALSYFAGYSFGGAVFVSAMLVLAALYACGPFATDPIAKRLLLAFAALFGAYLIVYFALGGDARDLPLTVFLNDLVLALGLVAMIECVRSYYASFKVATGWERIAYASGAAMVAFGLLGVTVYWSSLQVFLFRELPPEPSSVSALSI
jgi:hypothetical protein